LAIALRLKVHHHTGNGGITVGIRQSGGEDEGYLTQRLFIKTQDCETEHTSEIIIRHPDMIDEIIEMLNDAKDHAQSGDFYTSKPGSHEFIGRVDEPVNK
jgi:hypothetical protein